MLQNRPLTILFAGLHIGNSDFPSHHHEVWELIYQLDGTVTTEQGSRAIAMKPGMILVNPARVAHRDIFEQPYHLIYLFVEGSEVEMSDPVVYDDEDRSFGRLFEAVLREWHRRAPQREEMLRTLGMELEILLRRNRSHLANSSIPKWVIQAERILRNSVGTPVTVDKVAQQVGVSRSWFHEVFHDTYGRSPGDYVAHLRLEKALAMLRHSSHKVSFIASECGYGSTSHLSNHVKQETRLSPSQIRSEAIANLRRYGDSA